MTLAGDLQGLRLDRALASVLPQYSRSQVVRWIQDGYVAVDGNQLRPATQVQGGESVVVEADVSRNELWEPEYGIAFDVVHEDPDVLVVEKPAGLVVHPGSGNWRGTLVNGLLADYEELANLPRAGVVHRLDKDTSGLMMVARSHLAWERLSAAVAARQVERRYLVIAEGLLDGPRSVAEPIGRHPRNRLKRAVRTDGRQARTHFRPMESFRGHTLVEARLDTGRTHQIRVHLAWLHLPVVGDRSYGATGRMPSAPLEELVAVIRGFERHALHAAKLGFQHPASGDKLVFRSRLPTDMARLVDLLRADRSFQADRKP